MWLVGLRNFEKIGGVTERGEERKVKDAKVQIDWWLWKFLWESCNTVRSTPYCRSK
jgi:hypothetical protein